MAKLAYQNKGERKMDNNIQLEGNTAAIVQPLYVEKGWIKLIGLVYFITGIISCATIIGAVTGWIPVWIGHLLMKAEKSLKAGYENGNEAEIKDAMESLGLSAKIFGIVTIISMIMNVLMIFLMILYFIFIIFVIGVGVAGAASN